MMELLEAIKEVSDCPICLDQVSPPARQCENGHISCSRCSDSLPNCSLCKADYLPTCARPLEQILELLQRKCPYADKGCLYYPALGNHEQVCEYRNIKCVCGLPGSCKWTGTVHDWLGHANVKHEWSELSLDEVIQLKYSEMSLNRDIPTASYVYCHKVNNEVFLLRVFKENGIFSQCVRHIPTKTPNGVYYYEISFEHKERILFKTMIKATPMLDGDQLNNNCMSVVYDQIEHVQHTQGHIVADFKVIRM